MTIVLSWLMVVLVVTSTMLTIRLKRIGWCVGAVASMVGLAYSALTDQPAMCFLNVIYVGLNTYGFLKWKDKL